MLEFFTVQTPMARKIHTCDLCNGKIQVGEKYTRFSGKFEGEMFDTKHHALCTEIIRQYCDCVGDNEYDADSVRDWATEVVCGQCNHYDDDREDYTPCECSLFSCPNAIKRFSKLKEAPSDKN